MFFDKTIYQQNFSRIPISTNRWQQTSLKNSARLFCKCVTWKDIKSWFRIWMRELFFFVWRKTYPPIHNLSFNQVYELTFCNRILLADFIHKDFFITPEYCLHCTITVFAITGMAIVCSSMHFCNRLILNSWFLFMVKGNCISIELQFWRETLTFKLYMYVMYIVHVHCITDYYAQLLFCSRPG